MKAQQQAQQAQQQAQQAQQQARLAWQGERHAQQQVVKSVDVIVPPHRSHTTHHSIGRI